MRGGEEGLKRSRFIAGLLVLLGPCCLFAETEGVPRDQLRVQEGEGVVAGCNPPELATTPAVDKTPANERKRDDSSAFSAPGSAAGQLKESEKHKDSAWQFTLFDDALEPWFESKAELRKKSGLHIAMDYAALQMWADRAPEGREDTSGGGILRLSGSWALLNRGKLNTGRIVFSTDYRHRYTKIEPQEFGFHVGYLGIPGLLFHDMGLTLGELSWHQVLNGGKTWVVIGRFNPHNVFDVLGYANPWATFQNYAIVLNTSAAMPNTGTGIAASHWINDQWYVNAGVNDVNGHPTVTRVFEDYREIFAIGEIGWSPGTERALFEEHTRNRVACERPRERTLERWS